VSVHGPSRLHFAPLKLLNVDFCADFILVPAFHSNADPDPDPASKTNADPDPQPCLHCNQHKCQLY
jgi:hypothetical protein